MTEEGQQYKIEGVLSVVNEKKGGSDDKPWTLYSAKIADSWFSTFDSALANEARALKDQPVVAYYTTRHYTDREGNRQTGYNLSSVEPQGQVATTDPPLPHEEPASSPDPPESGQTHAAGPKASAGSSSPNGQMTKDDWARKDSYDYLVRLHQHYSEIYKADGKYVWDEEPADKAISTWKHFRRVVEEVPF